MLFSEVIGHETIKTGLIQGVKDSRISHAQLFLGQEGSGNLALALAYCQYISCPHKTDKDSCGTCPSCKKHTQFQFADLHFSFPIFNKQTGGSVSDEFLHVWRSTLKSTAYFDATHWRDQLDAENKQLIMTVKEAANIVKKLSLKSYEGGYKFMIIWLPEYMKPPVANKLLKILEEPPQNTIFLLVANQQDNMLSTILSRVQMLKVPRLADSDVRSALIAQAGVTSNDKLDTLVQLADGNYFNAWKQVKSADMGYVDSFATWMRHCYSKDYAGLLGWTNQMHTIGRENLKQFLSYSLHMFRQCIVRNYSGTQITRLAKAEEAFVSKFSPFINDRNIQDLIKEVEKSHLDIGRNGYAKLVLFDLSISLGKLLKK
jgi:DNA polymerase-3 subunit delta'